MRRDHREKVIIPRLPKWVIPTSTLSTTVAGRYTGLDVVAPGRVYPRLDLPGEAVKLSHCRAPVTTWEERDYVALRHLYVLAHLVGLGLTGRGRVRVS